MKETSYRVTSNGSTFSAHKGNNVIAYGCIERGDALQAIWIDAGSNPKHKYILQNDVVVRAKAMEI